MDSSCIDRYEGHGDSVAWRHISPAGPRESPGLRNTNPLDAIKQCVAFLLKIERIERVCTIKNSRGVTCYVLNVVISSSTETPAGRISNAERISTFQIQRTYLEFQELHYVVQQWSNQHPQVSSNHSRRSRLGDCSYCKFFQAANLPGAVVRLTTSKKKMLKRLEAFLDECVTHARLPRPSVRECQGFDHISSVVTTFLTEDLAPLALTQRR